MPRTNVKSKLKDVNPDYVRMYYEHQYDRIMKDEDHALAVSNIILTISALIITFGFNNRQSFGPILVLFLPVMIIAANISAILHIRENGKWTSSHRQRALHILEEYAPELYKYDREVTSSHKGGMNRRTVQSIIHYLFILIATILLVIFVLQLLGSSIL